MSLTNKALWVIERNLNRDLSLAELAQSCGVSRFHLAHAFGEATGLSVMDYIRKRRLSEAAIALAAGAGDILSIALDSGYASHEAFTRAFRAQFDATPEMVRKRESIADLAMIAPIRLVESAQPPLAPPRLERAGPFLFVGLSGAYIRGETEQIAAQWQRFMAGLYAEIADKVPTPPVGVAIRDEGEDSFTYLCAAEVTRFDAMPKGLSTLKVAEASYAVFEHKGHINSLHRTYAAIWNVGLDGRTPADAPSLERHGPSFDPRTGEGGVTIWIALAA